VIDRHPQAVTDAFAGLRIDLQDVAIMIVNNHCLRRLIYKGSIAHFGRERFCLDLLISC
jgi:hypothetical protein